MRLLILFLLFSFSSVFSQSKFKISGNIKSVENTNIVGASVSLKSEDKSSFAMSDSLGNFTINAVSDTITLNIQHFDYTDKKVPFYLQKDTTLFVVLQNSAAYLNEVIVENSKKRAFENGTAGKLNFNVKEFSLVPTLSGTTDIIKLLQLTPGVQNSGDANGYLYVRGGDPGHNAILYGETPIYGMSHLLGVFPFYNADHIQQVEFDKSSSNAKYGGRLSSTTVLKTNKKLPEYFQVQGNVGILASQLTLSVPVSTNTGFYISGRKTYIDEVIAPLLKKDTKKNDVQGMKYGFSDANFTFLSQFSKNNLLAVTAFASADELKIKDSNLNLKSSLRWSNFAVSPSLTSTISPAVSMSNAFYFTQYSNDLSMNQATVEMGVSSYVKDFGFNNSIKYAVKGIPLESGFQYVYHYVLPQNIAVDNLNSAVTIDENSAIKSSEAAVFITVKPTLLKNVTAEFGFRINYYAAVSDVSYLHFQPRVIFNFKRSDSYSFYAAYNRQNQYLSLITTSSVGIPTDFWIATSGGIKPQVSDEFSLGSTQLISNKITSSFGAFYRSMKNLLEYPYGVTQFNEVTSFKEDLLVGTGKAYGFEFMVRKNSGKFTGWLSYTLSWSDRTFEELNNGKTYFSKYDRRHNLSVVGMYDLNAKWNFGITQILSSGNRFTMPTSWYFVNNNPVKEYSEYNNAQMPNYIRTDLSVNYFFIKSAKKESALNFSIYNTFNIENPIYVVLGVNINDDKSSVVVTPEKKVLYKILPSISWRFKF
ncbi:carboxypeptidase-like regulatory domain-containing protein [Flavobacterium sp. TAB 87]|uniref:TonB-dependent receptor n=1 Tax=Flavobacterium sp. TAB 87 TaxID=1729581 RepID=UPI00076BDBF6|nr:carboxypeptidase-like regulatory domain-containing protein [Flavobacterium sp. TAB 87]KVV14474.1 hypothetical protein AP058_02369 [Flavobacterium sp. TAB 87]